MLSQLDFFISSLINWTESEKTMFFSDVYLKTYQAGEWLYEANQPCNKVYFINKGLLSCSGHDDKGRDFILHFVTENTFVTDIVGFLQEKPSLYSLRAIEQTECIIIPRSSLQWLYQNVQEGNKLGRILFERTYLLLTRRSRFNYLPTPEQKYQAMLDIYPGIDKRVSKRCISAYIGIDPAYFSRLKLTS